MRQKVAGVLCMRKWSSCNLANQVALFHKPEFPDVCIPAIIFVLIFNLWKDAY